MIGSLRGLLIDKSTPELLLECAGVGYEVSVPLSTFYELPECNSALFLLIQHVVREDANLLYGFSSSIERDLFRALVKVNGVGPKLGLTILSGLPPKQFVACILSGDSASLVKMPGVGKKTAERLVLDLKDKVAALGVDLTPAKGVNVAVGREPVSPIDDAQRALVSLGYKPVNASKAIAAIADADALSVEQLIKQALQMISR